LDSIMIKDKKTGGNLILKTLICLSKSLILCGWSL
jgi:hypothetical protein